jgi:hypothetical protein
MTTAFRLTSSASIWPERVSIGVRLPGGSFVGVTNVKGAGHASTGVNTSNLGRLTIVNNEGNEVVEAYAKNGNGQVEVRTPAIWALNDIQTASSGGRGGRSSTSAQIDGFDSDGDIDFTDFLVFVQNFTG